MLYGVEASPSSVVAAGPGYVAGAVHFDGSIQGGGPTYLSRASLTTPADNGLCSFSIWQKGFLAPGNLNTNTVLFVTDPASNYAPYFGMDVGPDQLLWAFLAGFDTYWGTGVPSYTTWMHMLGSVNTNLSAGNKIKVLYINDFLVTPDINNDANAAYMEEFNGKPFYFGDDTFSDGPTVDVADVWFAPGVGLHSGSTIPEATRRQFIDAGGNPVDPTTWPTSAVQFYGDAASFPTNHGTGGAFTLTGSLTSAATHP